MCDRLSISRDRFIRTTEPAHYEASQALWRRMQAAGDIYLGTYAGWYSVRDEAFYDESETKLGESGERFGPQGTPVQWTEEQTYFFRLSAYQDRLLRFYEANPGFIGPETRRNEVVSFVKGGLQDLSISRSTLSWGVPVPDAPGHVMYVWVDALTNYITALGFPDENAPLWRYWPADYHIIGKDIVRFHAVYWPAFLMSAGVAGSQARLRARLLVQPRREDVEIGRQCHRPLRARGCLWRRSASLFLLARSRVRPGRQLQP